MKTVREIHEFFMNRKDGKELSLSDFMNTVPGFIVEKYETGGENCNWTMAQEYYRICEKMCDDLLLVNVQPNRTMCLGNHYIGVDNKLSDEPEAIEKLLEYGAYDFKYRGFVYTRNFFTNSVLPIDGIKQNGDGDIGTAFYIGDNRFVTAAHCVKDMRAFNILKPDGNVVELNEVWFAKDQDVDAYDLAVLTVNGQMDMPAFILSEPAVLDDVLVMGYPPISGFNAIQTSETATVGAYQKSSTGQIVGADRPYMLPLDFFLINARVKGGNSGGPVINNGGHVIGIVVKLPFDSQSDSNNPRYDLMGYGVCLPSKYIGELLRNPEVRPLTHDKGYYHF